MPRSTFFALILTLVAAADRMGGAEPRTYGGKPASRWIQELSNASANARVAAAKALAEVGGEDAVGPLLERLRDPDGDTRLNAAYALGRIGKQPEKTIAALIRLCGDGDEHVRYSAQWALGQLSSKFPLQPDAPAEDQTRLRQLLAAAARAVTESGAPEGIRKRIQTASEALLQAPALPVATKTAPSPASSPPNVTASETPMKASPDELLSLIRSLRSSDAFVVMQGLTALKRLDCARLPLLMQSVAAGFQDTNLVETLPEALAELGEPALPALIDALEHGDESVRSLVAEVICKMGKTAGQALPALTALVGNGEEAISDELREKAFAALAAMGPAAANATQPLARLLGDAQQRVEFRTSAAMVLRQIGPGASGAESELLRVLRSDSAPVELRAIAAEALARVNPRSSDTLLSFQRLLKLRDNIELCPALACTAGTLGPLAAPLVPELVTLIEDDSIDDEQRQRIILAIGEIGPAAQQAVPALIHMLIDSEHATSIQVASAITLGKIGPPAVTALIAQSEHAEAAARLTVVRALAEIGARAAPAVDCLSRLLANGKEEAAIRTQAAIALSKIGAPARPAVQALTKLVADEQADERLRAMSIMAIGSIEPGLSPFVAAALADPAKHLQIAAAFTLHKLKCEGQRPVQHLLSLLTDEIDEIVDLAQQALVDIGEDAIPILAIASKEKSRDIGLRLRCVEALGRLGQDDGVALPTAQAAVPPLLDALGDDELAETASGSLTNLGRSVIPVLLTAANDEARYTPAVREGIRDVVRSHFEGLGAGPDELQWDLSRLQAGIAGDSGDSGSGKRIIRLDGINVMGREPAAGAAPAPAASSGNGAAAPEATSSTNIETAIEAQGYKTVQVFYGTNRKPLSREGGASGLPISLRTLWSLNGLSILAFAFCLACLVWQKAKSPLAITAVSAGLAILIGPHVPLPAFLGKRLASGPSLTYGGECNDQLELGVCAVTIPEIHETGELEAPSIFRLEITADPEKHVILRSVEHLNNEAFFSQLSGEIGRKGRNILVFIHGYNVSFEDAARRTAQMTIDLKFPGAALFYSWPSQANWYQYRLDERNVELSVEPLKTFLLDVAKNSGATTIDLVAHSMGNRALTGALKEIDASATSQGALFNQVILAAPDIDATVFKKRIAPAIVTKARQITLYASSKDLALFASRQFNSGGPRAGDAGEELVLVPGVETIDASAGDCSLLGHNYYGSSISVLRDIEHLLKNEPAKDRPFLDPVPLGEMTYWLFHPPTTAADTRQTEQLR